MYAHIYTHASTHLYTCLSTCLHACPYAYLYTCLYACLFTGTGWTSTAGLAPSGLAASETLPGSDVTVAFSMAALFVAAVDMCIDMCRSPSIFHLISSALVQGRTVLARPPCMAYSAATLQEQQILISDLEPCISIADGMCSALCKGVRTPLDHLDKCRHTYRHAHRPLFGIRRACIDLCWASVGHCATYHLKTLVKTALRSYRHLYAVRYTSPFGDGRCDGSTSDRTVEEGLAV